MVRNKIEVHHYKVVKVNKSSWIYKSCGQRFQTKYRLTELIKFEKFQGHSKGQGDYYLRIRETGNWADKQNAVSLLKRTRIEGTYFGDYCTSSYIKTNLILFKFDRNWENLTIKIYPFYCSKMEIESLAVSFNMQRIT